ncbi:MAG: D-alanyl-lipoteichoic acid biosynthesis protein DltB [Eubacteriales bacterium]|nr:D-alanyl-lipoteichoic acid biosynthesis protein DltB [Eubacteriales bacterium]
MQLLSDFYFFLCLALVSIPAVYLGVKERSIKYYGAFVTVFFVVLAMYGKPIALLYLFGYVVFEFILVKTYLKIKEKYGRNSTFYWIYIILSLSPLIICKVSEKFDMHILAFLGISYMTFKSVQIIIEIYDGIIKEIKAVDYFTFLLFFPTITSGPIDRSRRFIKDFNSVMPKEDYLELLGTGIFKIFLGLCYKMVLATAFYQAMTWGGTNEYFLSDLVYMYSYGFYLFFDFAGYSLMAVGISYIFGIKTPDNFNKPFISKDMKEFWDRWHISLSYWFRDFIFSRIMMKAIKNKWFKEKLTAASFGFIINMTIMGVWHGLDNYYILYGFYHGLLLALTEIYQKKCPLHKKYKKEKWYKTISWFITFNLVMFGFFIFSGRFTKLIGI